MATVSNPVRFLSSARPVTNDRELLLTMFSGEILTAFEDSVAVADKIMYKSITSGDTYQFIATGNIGSEYHEPGTELFGLDFRTAQRKISIDGYLVSHFAVADIDLALAHFDVRGEMANKVGYALSRTFDINALSTIARSSLINLPKTSSNYIPATVADPLAAAATTPGVDPKVTAHYGGSIITGDLLLGTTTGDVYAQVLYDSIALAALVLDMKNVSKEGRWCVVKPQSWYLLMNGRNSSSPFQFVNLNRDWNTQLVGMQPSTAQFVDINGIKVFPSNRMPATTVTTGPSKYQFPWTSLVAVVWQTEAAASLVREGMSIESTRDTRRLEDFTVAKMLAGHGILRPDCAVTIWDDAIGTTTVADSGAVGTLAGTATTAFNL